MRRIHSLILALAAGLLPVTASGAGADSVMLEELTSTELRDRIAAGTTTVLVPIGGTEQNGPHMVLGKHNVRVRVLAARIAESLGHTIVAPVIAYVPEGTIDPPSQHMRWAGTISVPEAAFEAVLEGAARSLRRHGFRDIVFLGDHGGYRKNAEQVALRLNREFGARATVAEPTRVHALAEYYQVTQTGYVRALQARGHGDEEIGQHAGLADTALALAVDPALVRAEAMRARPPGTTDGVSGDPRQASAELGRLGTEQVVAASVAAIQLQLRGHGSHADKPRGKRQGAGGG